MSFFNLFFKNLLGYEIKDTDLINTKKEKIKVNNSLIPKNAFVDQYNLKQLEYKVHMPTYNQKREIKEKLQDIEDKLRQIQIKHEYTKPKKEEIIEGGTPPEDNTKNPNHMNVENNENKLNSRESMDIDSMDIDNEEKMFCKEYNDLKNLENLEIKFNDIIYTR